MESHPYLEMEQKENFILKQVEKLVIRVIVSSSYCFNCTNLKGKG